MCLLTIIMTIMRWFGNKCIIFAVVAFLLNFLSSCSGNIEKELMDSDEARWLYELTDAKYNGRVTGTLECHMAGDYIISELQDMGYEPIVQEFIFRDNIKMRNIIVEIEGPSDSICVIGAHYDGAVYSPEHPAAEDNASGVVAVLSIAKDGLIQTDKTVLLCFWDGEESTLKSICNGSRYFTENYDSIDKVSWYCNIDGCGRNKSMIYYYYSADLQDVCHVGLINSIGSASKLEIQEKVQFNRASDYASFAKINIPFWGWTDMNTIQYIHTPNDIPDKISINKIISVAKTTTSIISYL